MVLTRAELIAALQHENRILLHLAGKIDRAKLGYRPTPGQRSTIELVRYLTMMGPALVQVALAGTFDPAIWTDGERGSEGLDLDQAMAKIAEQGTRYAELLGGVSDADLRAEVAIFGGPSSRGAFLVNQVLCGCAAYRTQLFLYLKACGREELNTVNLWAGLDPPGGG